MKKSTVLLGLIILLSIFLAGCSLIQIEEAPLRELPYSLVKQEEIPQDLKNLIAGKKKKEFQLTYQMGKELYLIKGYGQQMSGGYSIQITMLGVSENAVIFQTRLLGPKSPEEAVGEPSYPYIVVKTEYQKEPVQFQ